MSTGKIIPGFLFLIGLSISTQSQENLMGKNVWLSQKIDSMRVAFNIPAIAYGIIRNDTIISLNVMGYRDIETKDKAQPGDYFHIGSNTKSFTAFLAGRLIDEGIIDWETRFFDLYPELMANSNPAYGNMTLQQLLSHRARLINFSSEPELSTIIAEYEETLENGLDIDDKRYWLFRYILQKEPLPVFSQCGDCYSNAGYLAAALMLEKASGMTWEELIMRLSGDLKLDLYIGWPVDYDPGEPRGHINPKYWFLDIDRDLVPISDQLRMYHPYNQSNLLTNPSGNLSIRTGKFLEFLRLHLEGLRGQDNYLKSSTYQHILNTYPIYSLGWWVNEADGSKSYGHRGSNGTFFSYAGLFPEENTGIVVMINTYNEVGLTDIINVIRETFSTAPRP